MIEIESTKLTDEIFFQFKVKEALVIENLNKNISENLLFSLYNIALQDNKYFLITSEKPINKFDFTNTKALFMVFSVLGDLGMS